MNNMVTLRKAVLFNVALLFLMFRAQGQANIILSSPNTSGTYSATNSVVLRNGFSAGGLTLFSAAIIPGSAIPLPASNATSMVSKWIPRTAVNSQASLKALENNTSLVNITNQYSDGLGQIVEVVAKGATQNNADLVKFSEYENTGKELRSYLPYAYTGTTPGAYRPSAVTEQQAFYSGTTNVANISTPYAEQIQEVSPLGRTLESSAPGDAWKLSGPHTKKTDYLSNNTVAINDLANTRIALNYGVSIDAYGNRSLMLNVVNGYPYYAAEDLFVNVYKDENWRPEDGRLGTQEVYLNKSNKTILKRQFVKGPSGNVKILSTYFVYDDFDNLCFVLTPGASPDIVSGASDVSVTSDLLSKYCYQYQFDIKQREVGRKFPGKDWEYTVYNKLNRVVATQDGNQRIKNEWTVAKYDALDRAIISGVWNNGNSTITRSSLQSILDGETVFFESKTGTGNGYTSDAWPQAFSDIRSISYYDTYDIPGLPSGYGYQTYSGNPGGASSQTEGYLTGNKTWFQGAALWAVDYYDDQGRVIQVQKGNHIGGKDIINNEYSFTDQITKTSHEHSSGSASLTILNRNVYDHHGRLVQTFKKIGGDSEVLLSQLSYNEIGQLVDKKLHQKSGNSTFLQSIDYRYNSRGWLTSINDPSLSSSSALNADDNTSDADKFGMAVKYDQALLPQFNGNIGSVEWQNAPLPNSSAASVYLKYDFRYDAVNRLKESVSSTGSVKDKNFDEYLSYDDMGNITSLGRWAKLSSGRTQIDSLSYNYLGNRVDRIDDGTGNYTYGFSEYIGGNNVRQSAEYEYDANGNVTKNLNKGITLVTYNDYNRPLVVTWADGKTLTYYYDGAGEKLKKTFYNGSSTIITDYVGDIQYNQGQIEFIATDEGMVRPSGTSYIYQYAIKDQLGNTHLMIQPVSPGETVAEVIQVSNYYPFGLEMQSNDPASLISFISGAKNNYLYNDKEFQDGIGEYDYGARLYDPAIGRWSVVDALSDHPNQIEKSPYAYGWNNPIVRSDPDGNCPVCIIVGAVVGGVYNMATHWKSGDLKHNLIAFGVGALAGGIAGATLNPAVFEGAVALSSAAQLSAMTAAAAQGAFAGMVSNGLQQVGNTIAFNEPLSLRNFVMSAAMGGVTGYVGKYIQIKLGVQSSPASSGAANSADEPLPPLTPKTVMGDVPLNSPSTNTGLAPFYPPNEGALGAWEQVNATPGQLMDRYGNPYGTYASPVGTPFNMRALPPSTNINDYIKFEVLKPFPMGRSFIAPTAWDIGLGIQYKLPMSVSYLEYFKYIKIVKP